jgi:hypothetical protein
MNNRDTFYRLLAAIFVVALMAACGVGVRAKVDSRPSPEDQKQVEELSHRLDTVYGTTAEACQYQITPDGIITVTSGNCPVSNDGKTMTTQDTDSCLYEITQHSKTIVVGSKQSQDCGRRHPIGVGDVTTDIVHGTDGCDYALARDGENTKVPGSCLKDAK